MIYLFK